MGVNARLFLIDFFLNCVTIFHILEGFSIDPVLSAIELPTPNCERLQKLQEDLKASGADVRWSILRTSTSRSVLRSIEESQIDSILQSIEISVQSKQPFWSPVRAWELPSSQEPKSDLVGLVEGKECSSQFQSNWKLRGKGWFQPKIVLPPHLIWEE